MTRDKPIVTIVSPPHVSLALSDVPPLSYYLCLQGLVSPGAPSGTLPLAAAVCSPTSPSPLRHLISPTLILPFRKVLFHVTRTFSYTLPSRHLVRTQHQRAFCLHTRADSCTLAIPSTVAKFINSLQVVNEMLRCRSIAVRLKPQVENSRWIRYV